MSGEPVPHRVDEIDPSVLGLPLTLWPTNV